MIFIFGLNKIFELFLVIRLLLFVWQWSDLRHMQSKSRRRSSDLYQFKSFNCASCVFNDGFTAVRRCYQCGFNWISNQFGAISTDPFPISNIRTNHFTGKSISRKDLGSWNHESLLWASQSNGQMQSTRWKVHVLLHAVQRRYYSTGRQLNNSKHQENAYNSICWLVSNWI